MIYTLTPVGSNYPRNTLADYVHLSCRACNHDASDLPFETLQLPYRITAHHYDYHHAAQSTQEQGFQSYQH